MSVLAWIIVSGLAMRAIALVGSVSVLMPGQLFRRLVMPLVALAAGALPGGAMFRPRTMSITVRQTGKCASTSWRITSSAEGTPSSSAIEDSLAYAE